MTGLYGAMMGAAAQGILWGIMVIGVYITFRLLNIADMTVDGSFALGGCVCAIMIMNFGINPFAAILIAVAAGVLAGAVTGFLHTMFDIPAILAGILTQISLWSINLRIMGGKSNVPLLKTETIISRMSSFVGGPQSTGSLVTGIIVAILIIAVLYWFFGTEIGSALRATGNNEAMIRALGVDIRKTKLMALMISNGLVALSGALVCQSQKYADVGMGTGAIVIGLAAIVIGEVLLGWLVPFWAKLSSIVVGSVVYFIIRAIVLQLGMNPNDMKLLSAIIVALALCVPVAMKKFQTNRSYTEGDENDA
ncbi:MAG: ABC transporter permease [Firmicutes bacterium]|nr:ABC transporter permease [Bacillota bacterium]